MESMNENPGPMEMLRKQSEILGKTLSDKRPPDKTRWEEDRLCRDTAGCRLDGMIIDLERRLLAVKMLRKIVENVEVGSPLEELLYDLTGRIK